MAYAELPIRTGVPLDKVPKRFRNVVTIDIAARLDFEGDIFRDVLRPTLGGVESDDADRVVELPRHQIGYDSLKVCPFDVGFAIGSAKGAKTVDHEVDGLIRAIGHNRRGPVCSSHTQNSTNANPTPGNLSTNRKMFRPRNCPVLC